MRGDGGRDDCDVVAKIWSETPLERFDADNEEVDLGLGNRLIVELDGVGGFVGSFPVEVGCVVLTGDVDLLET